MKLMTHTSLFWVTMGMILFFLLGVSFYEVFKELSEDRLEKELLQEKNLVLSDPEGFIRNYENFGSFFQHIRIDTIERSEQPFTAFHDSVLQNEPSGEYHPVRCIHFSVPLKEQTIVFHICQSRIASDELTERITLLIAAMALLFVLGLFILNRHVFTRTWKGFYDSLRTIKNYRAGDPVPDFEENEIDEFDDLNNELVRMTDRITRDYHNLQSFTSHAAHEFRTPIAVIQSQAEVLLQSESLNSTQLQQVNQIIQSSRQLNRITQALSLLFKIDNNQYLASEKVDFESIVLRNADSLTEQCQAMSLHFKYRFHEPFIHQMNADLAEVLIMNLLRNAITHNVSDGSIEIRSEKGCLSVLNTGTDEPLNTDLVFSEFYKGDASGGLGLGLVIAKKIANQYQLRLQYRFESGFHIFELHHLTLSN